MPAIIYTNRLDHIVHLTPPGSVQAASEQFRKLGFHVIDGGTHADGLTANALVVFSDGVYLELISFTHPVSHYPPTSPSYHARTHHQWANKDPGWVAYSMLGAPGIKRPISERINSLAASAGLDLRYAPEVPGGRQRPDGVELKWEITAPERWAEKEGGMRLPFFCGDVTSRTLRVPTQPGSNTEHENGAHGIAHLRVIAPHSSFADVSRELTSVFIGEPPIVDSPTRHAWLLKVPGKANWHPRLILNEVDEANEAEKDFVRSNGAGLFEIGVRVGNGVSGSVQTPYGKVVWVPASS
ncbi:hypothetical protein FA95DRAFT_564448 [Auriscalpium vulgare]|uniref:Uncharacterized protein n=1 Tax=Auriscalpium vulgare TaxID=40419 RepID=A0ACB8REI3_9AGAM|nr:hypothetical protein FA95DRAFT_564448 [Auriscalpium vulgare]